MSGPAYFLSCDWGTTNFRLRAVETGTLAVVAEASAPRGVRSLHEGFRESGSTDREGYFAAFLREQIDALPPAHRGHPLVVSGMASANIGLRELPYGTLPITREAESFVLADLALWPGQALRLVSGVGSGTALMRGEETQALGLLERMDPACAGVLLLPGTHSKHLEYQGGQFTGFTTYLTGELFELLSRRSILADSVAAAAEWNAGTEASFRRAVRQGYDDGSAAHLFAIRAAHLRGQADPGEAYYRLSGLLIGEELARLPRRADVHVYVAAADPLPQLYRAALETIGFGDSLTVFTPAALVRALLAGQRQLLFRTT